VRNDLIDRCFLPTYIDNHICSTKGNVTQNMQMLDQ